MFVVDREMMNVYIVVFDRFLIRGESVFFVFFVFMKFSDNINNDLD